MDFQNVSKENIWNYKQNKPSLIVKDLKQHGLDEETIYKILLSRGVFKWLAVRRDLIKLKNVWKDRIKATLANIALQKKENNPYKLGYTRGYLKAYEDCRAEIRVLCHSERWQAPDFDKKAIKFLKELEEKKEVCHDSKIF